MYRFDEEWNGEVIAESRADFMHSYKGLHFPASDIPEQARQLYMTNYIRLISDVSYTPVMITPQLHPKTGEPLDMSLATLRSVSPIHLQYLANMGVKASMSVSIIKDEKLWGLIACHNSTTLHVSYRVRMAAEILGHIFSAQLSTIEELIDTASRSRRLSLLDMLSAGIESNKNLKDLATGREQFFLESMNSQGLTLFR